MRVPSSLASWRKAEEKILPLHSPPLCTLIQLSSQLQFEHRSSDRAVGDPPLSSILSWWPLTAAGHSLLTVFRGELHVLWRCSSGFSPAHTTQVVHEPMPLHPKASMIYKSMARWAAMACHEFFILPTPLPCESVEIHLQFSDSWNSQFSPAECML